MGVRLFKKYFVANLKAFSEFRLSFLFSSFSMLVTNFFFIGSILYLAYKFNGIGSLSFEMILFALTVTDFAYIFGLTFFLGVTRFQEIIINGELDRLLIRPISLYEHILIYRINPSFLAEIMSGLVLIALCPINLWPFIFFFSITGAILMNLNLYTLNLLPMFLDLNKPVNFFDLYTSLAFYVPDIYFDVLQKIAFFIIPGAMVGFGAAYALSSFNWVIIYFSFFIFSIIAFLVLSNIGIKKYRSAGY
jgi:ABC-2 type transport system permease protein